MGLSYDRRAPQELLDALRPGGWAHSLVEYGRSGQYALDLQLRGYASKPEHWATLYVGLTKVLDLRHHSTRGFRLDAHPTYCVPKFGWDPAWSNWADARLLSASMPAIEDYLERVVPSIGPRYLREGAVQSAISGFSSTNMVVIDREATVRFSSQKERVAVTSRLAAPLLRATDRSNGAAWWSSRPPTLGTECDALAVDIDGRLLAIEVKPPNATGTIAWSPLQVRQYASLFSEWASTELGSAEIIQGMVDQRAELGLAGHAPRVRKPLEVRPMIAIGRRCSSAAMSRLTDVQGRLIEAGLDDPPLAVVSVTLAGRLDPWI
jgi:hypothetical protein